MRRREFLAGASAAAAFTTSKPMHAAQAADARPGEDLITEGNSEQAAARADEARKKLAQASDH